MKSDCYTAIAQIAAERGILQQQALHPRSDAALTCVLDLRVDQLLLHLCEGENLNLLWTKIVALR